MALRVRVAKSGTRILLWTGHHGCHILLDERPVHGGLLHVGGEVGRAIGRVDQQPQVAHEYTLEQRSVLIVDRGLRELF